MYAQLAIRLGSMLALFKLGHPQLRWIGRPDSLIVCGGYVGWFSLLIYRVN